MIKKFKNCSLWREQRENQFKTIKIDDLTAEDFQEDPIYNFKKFYQELLNIFTN